MKSPAAFRASYSDMKLVKTRQVAQLIFEIPLADFDAAYEVLGGMPNPANERWFGIAAIQIGKEAMPNPQQLSKKLDARPQSDHADKPDPAGAKRDWRDLQPQQQAGIRCGEPTFQAFLKEQHRVHWDESGPNAAECVRLICGVQSRVELGTNHTARMIWHHLDNQFQAWKHVEHA